LGHVDRGRVVDNYRIFVKVCSRLACGAKATPLLDCLGSTADKAFEEAIVAVAIAGADMAALGIDHTQVVGFAKPIGADAASFVDTSAANPAIVPPAAAAD
jgi:hypothetical protein